MAQKKYATENTITYLWAKIKAAFALKGDVPTKTSQLTNDSDFAVDASYVHTDSNYTSAEKTKLGAVADGAQVNVIESVKVNGSALSVSGKAVDVAVPTKTSEITNDSNFAVDAGYVHTDNNYTDEDKTKLGGVAAGAQVNVLESVKVNGTALSATGKAVDITVPTNNNQLTNGAGYQTATEVQEAIGTALSSVYTVKGSVDTYAELPTSGRKTGDVYNVVAANGDTPAGTNYVFNGSSWDALGGTIDLSGYVQSADLVEISNTEIDAIVDAA